MKRRACPDAVGAASVRHEGLAQVLKRGQEMTSGQRIIMTVFLTLLSCGAFGAALNSWTGIFVGVCIGVTFGLFEAEDGNDEEQRN